MEDMCVISALEPQKKKQNRYNVFIDGEYACSLSADSCVVFDIKAGKQICEDELKQAVMSDNTQYAFDSAVNLISFKMRTRSEIFEKLLNRKIDEQAIEAALEKLENYGYVNDRDYAAEYVRSAMNSGRYGKRVIEFKMKQKGIDDDVIEQALQIYTPDEEKQMARKLLVSLRRKYQDEDDFKKRRKIFSGLARRGFDYDIINTLLSEENED